MRESSKPDVILTTGSSGFIGFSLANRLSQNYEVVGFDQSDPPEPTADVDRISMDLTSDADVQRAFAQLRRNHGEKIASVVHLVAYYDFSGKPSDKYETITVEGTRRLLRELRQFDVEQFIYASSMLVHAPTQPGIPITEDSLLDPKWDYPKSKLRAEQLVMEEHGDIPVLIMRISGVYDDLCNSVPLANQIQRIYERQIFSHLFPGDADRGQDFMHLDDLLDAIVCAIERRQDFPDELTLLIGEGQTLSYDRLQREFGWLIFNDKNWQTKEIPKAVAKLGASAQERVSDKKESFIRPWMIDLADSHFELDITRANKFLGWQPKHTLKDSLPHMVQHLKDNPREFYEKNKLSPPSWLERESA